MTDVIPFYGAEKQEIFQIERMAMDRQGKVVQFLNDNLPNGLILDLGAGDGYTASKIKSREVICLEPASGMVNFNNNHLWAKGSAENIPFHDNYFDGAYTTWAYFLPGVDKRKGLAELERVVKPDGTIIIVDNAGEDEFCSFSSTPIFEGPDFYVNNGFSPYYITTAFEFETIKDATKLMKLYFGKNLKDSDVRLRYEYKVVAYVKMT